MTGRMTTADHRPPMPPELQRLLRQAILVIKAGSRPIRQKQFSEAKFTGTRHRANLIAKDDTGAPIVDAYFKKGATHEDALVSLLHRLERRLPQHEMFVTRHRVARGGAVYQEPVLIDAKVAAELTRLVPLRPSH